MTSKVRIDYFGQGLGAKGGIKLYAWYIPFISNNEKRSVQKRIVKGRERSKMSVKRQKRGGEQLGTLVVGNMPKWKMVHIVDRSSIIKDF